LPYVIAEPESIKGVCETWDECGSKVEGVKGARYQKVHDEAEAQALLKGTGVVLKPDLHVFTDGNHRGGVGVVIVWMTGRVVRLRYGAATRRKKSTPSPSSR
jgi:hypothetical protein